MFMVAPSDGAPVGAGGTIIYFVCDDCAQAAKRAKEAGGHIVKDKFSIGDYGNIALDDGFHETGIDEASKHGTGSMLVDSSFQKI
jgi:hypothetical protein